MATGWSCFPCVASSLVGTDLSAKSVSSVSLNPGPKACPVSPFDGIEEAHGIIYSFPVASTTRSDGTADGGRFAPAGTSPSVPPGLGSRLAPASFAARRRDNNLGSIMGRKATKRTLTNCTPNIWVYGIIIYSGPHYKNLYVYSKGCIAYSSGIGLNIPFYSFKSCTGTTPIAISGQHSGDLFVCSSIENLGRGEALLRSQRVY